MRKSTSLDLCYSRQKDSDFRIWMKFRKSRGRLCAAITRKKRFNSLISIWIENFYICNRIDDVMTYTVSDQSSKTLLVKSGNIFIGYLLIYLLILTYLTFKYKGMKNSNVTAEKIVVKLQKKNYRTDDWS